MIQHNHRRTVGFKAEKGILPKLSLWADSFCVQIEQYWSESGLEIQHLLLCLFSKIRATPLRLYDSFVILTITSPHILSLSLSSFLSTHTHTFTHSFRLQVQSVPFVICDYGTDS